MNDELKPGWDLSKWIWPAVILVVLAALLGIQMLRVNKHEEPPVAGAAPVTYSTPGPVFSGTVGIAGGDFTAKQVNLNRRGKISGEFQTGSTKSRVAITLVEEKDFETWKQQPDFKGRVSTGYVPGGKINPVLEPGSYYLIIDNRANQTPMSVQANFMLE